MNLNLILKIADTERDRPYYRIHVHVLCTGACTSTGVELYYLWIAAPRPHTVIEWQSLPCFDRMATVAKDNIALSVLQTARADAAAGKHKSAIQNFRRALAMGGPSAVFAEEAAQELAKVEAVVAGEGDAVDQAQQEDNAQFISRDDLVVGTSIVARGRAAKITQMNFPLVFYEYEDTPGRTFHRDFTATRNGYFRRA